MNVAILGLGTVGRGVYELLQNRNDFTIRYVLERDPTILQNIKAPVANDYNEILHDPKVDIIIELIGGIDTAYSFILQALKHKKHVVTANKAVVSRYYSELLTVANENNVSILYEASVGGAIILLHPLHTISQVNHIDHIEGIVNGATNFVLSRIFNDGVPTNQAVEEAHQLGYLEPTSTDDLDGLDAMRKIVILSTIAYQGHIDETDVTVVPLSGITPEFFQHVQQLGYTMKYIARSTKTPQGVTISVVPVILSLNHPLANIHNEYNSIAIHGAYHKTQTFIGQGAGRYPTAQAVMYDLLLLQNHQVPHMEYPNPIQIIPDEPKQYLLQTTQGFVMTQPVLLNQITTRDDVICFALWEVQ